MSRARPAGFACLILVAAVSRAADRDGSRAAAEVAAELIGAGVMGAPAVVQTTGTTTQNTPAKSDGTARIVVIDGKRWREAPSGTPEIGPPGTRIILDGQVYLDAELVPIESVVASSAVRPAAAPAATEDTPVTTGQPAVMPEKRGAGDRAVVGQAPADRAATDRVATDRVTTDRIAIDRVAADPATVNEAAAEAANEAVVMGTSKDAPSLGAANGVADAVPADDVVPEGTRRPVVGPGQGEALSESASVIVDGERAPVATPVRQALRLPTGMRSSSGRFSYVDAVPLSYDYGGGGLLLEGSASLRGRFRALARLGSAADYREFLVGGSWYVTPTATDRLTLVLTAGVETGRFELEARGVSTELSDTGLHVSAASRLVVNERFELQAGAGYSSFFEGDPFAFGGGSYRITHRLDVVSRFELGDNDSLGVGVRYHY